MKPGTEPRILSLSPGFKRHLHQKRSTRPKTTTGGRSGISARPEDRTENHRVPSPRGKAKRTSSSKNSKKNARRPHKRKQATKNPASEDSPKTKDSKISHTVQESRENSRISSKSEGNAAGRKELDRGRGSPAGVKARHQTKEDVKGARASHKKKKITRSVWRKTFKKRRKREVDTQKNTAAAPASNKKNLRTAGPPSNQGRSK